MGRVRGGAKVPNVKLRPAAKLAGLAKPDNDKEGHEDSDDDVLEDPEPQSKANVFHKVVVSATGIKSKRQLFDIVTRLGGGFSVDLTDFTTHLIADAPGSEKYQCAVERGIPVMKSSWITDIHEHWLAGEAINLPATIDDYRLPVFQNFKICITGITSADERERIHKAIKSNDGEFLKALDKTCTHLLCGEAATEKVTWALKVNSEREMSRPGTGGLTKAPIHVIWSEWFWDCIKHHGLLKVEPYLISNPRPEAAPSEDRPKIQPVPQHLRPSNLESNDEPVTAVKRVKYAAERQWEAIIKPRGPALFTGGTVNPPKEKEGTPDLDTASPMKKTWKSGPSITSKPGWSKRSPVKKSSTIQPDNIEDSNIPRKISVIPLADSRPKLPGLPKGKGKGKSEADPPPPTFLGKFQRSAAFDDPAIKTEIHLPASNEAKNKKIFSNLKFCALGAAASDVLYKALRDAGGSISAEGEEVDFYIVRIAGGTELMTAYTLSDHSKFRTECWVERCLGENRQCDVEENITFRPLRIENPLQGASAFSLSVSGLDAWERVWVQRLCRTLGIKASLTFSSRNTHLLCPSRSGAKFEKAKQWNIPVVALDWLTKMATTGVIEGSSSSTPAKVQTKNIFRGEDESIVLANMSTPKPVRVLVNPTDGDLLGQLNLAGSPAMDTMASDLWQSLPQDSFVESADVGAEVIPEALDVVTNKTSITRTPARNRLQSVPSSVSPSPFVLSPTKKRLEKEIPAAKPDFYIDHASAKELHKNIGAVLGIKRTAEDLDSVDGNASTSESARKRPKRPRPGRSKVSEEDSLEARTSVKQISSYDVFGSVSFQDESFVSSEGEPASQEQESVRVHYEDPGSRAERQRLLRLVGGNSANDYVQQGKKGGRATGKRRGKAKT